MKVRALLAATALLFSTIAAPALASQPPLGPPETDGLTPQQVCELELQPNNPNSKFQTAPSSEVTGGWVNDGDPVQGSAVGLPYGVGIPTPGDVTFNGTYIRHGGSPNVWGGASSTLVYPQTGQVFNFTQEQTRTTTFNCDVFKFNPNDVEIDPAGLETLNNSIVETQTNEFTAEVVTDDDFTVTGQTVDVLICISPNNSTKGKPGTWRQMHGFTGSCTAASTAAGTSFIPSHNNPTTDPDISF